MDSLLRSILSDNDSNDEMSTVRQLALLRALSQMSESSAGDHVTLELRTLDPVRICTDPQLELVSSHKYRLRLYNEEGDKCLTATFDRHQPFTAKGWRRLLEGEAVHDSHWEALFPETDILLKDGLVSITYQDQQFTLVPTAIKTLFQETGITTLSMTNRLKFKLVTGSDVVTITVRGCTGSVRIPVVLDQKNLYYITKSYSMPDALKEVRMENGYYFRDDERRSTPILVQQIASGVQEICCLEATEKNDCEHRRFCRELRDTMEPVIYPETE